MERLLTRFGLKGVRLREVGKWHFPELGELGIEDLHLRRTEHYTTYKYLPFRFNRSVSWRVWYVEYGASQHHILNNPTRCPDDIIDSILYGYEL